MAEAFIKLLSFLQTWCYHYLFHMLRGINRQYTYISANIKFLCTLSVRNGKKSEPLVCFHSCFEERTTKFYSSRQFVIFAFILPCHMEIKCEIYIRKGTNILLYFDWTFYWKSTAWSVFYQCWPSLYTRYKLPGYFIHLVDV